MAEIINFFLFVSLVVFLFYLLFVIIIPFLLFYLTGGLTFFIVSIYLIRRGMTKNRIPGEHLDSSTVRWWVLSAVFILLVYSAIVFFIHQDHLLYMLQLIGLNTVSVILWLGLLFYWHIKKRKKFLSQGGMLKTLKERIIRKREALLLKKDSLIDLLNNPPVIEDWEREVLPSELLELSFNTNRINQLIEDIDSMIRHLDNLNERVETLQDNELDELRNTLNVLRSKYNTLIERANNILNEYLS